MLLSVVKVGPELLQAVKNLALPDAPDMTGKVGACAGNFCIA
jgi:hypothetical protein